MRSGWKGVGEACMYKDYGKLTVEQFTEFIRYLPGIFAMLRDVDSRLARTSTAKFDSVMYGDYGDYSMVYELPFIQHLTFVVVALNRRDDVAQMAAAPDPQEAVLEMLRRQDEVEDKPQHEAFDDTSVVALVYALSRSMQSMATYGRSMSSLLQDVRDKGNHDSLFKAIRMDRAVVGCPTAMKHIARAQMRGDKAFFKKLRTALGGPGQKQQAGLDLLRYAMLILREIGLDHISEADLEELMVEKLKVYPRNQPNARKNIRAHYQRAKKLPTI